jgi:hypothetical protein
MPKRAENRVHFKLVLRVWQIEAYDNLTTENVHFSV